MVKDDTPSTWPVLIPAAIGAGIAGRRAIQDITSGRANVKSWFQNPLRNTQTARDYALSNSIVQRTASPDVVTNRLQQMSQQRTWTTGLNPGWARRAVAESMRASLLSETRLGINEINQLTQDILQPNTIPYLGTGNIFDKALESVNKYGKPQIFERLMGRYTSGHMPGEFLNPQEMETIMGAQTGKFFKTQHNRIQGTQYLSRSIRLQEPEENMLKSFKTLFNRVGNEDVSIRELGIYSFGKAKTAEFNVRINNAAMNIRLPLQRDVFYTEGSRAILPTIVTGLPSAGNLKPMSWGEYYAQKLVTEIVPEVATATAGLPAKEARKVLKEKIQALNAELSDHFVRSPIGANPGADFINRMNASTLVLPELTEAVAQQHPERILDEEFARLYKEGVPGIGEVYPAGSGHQMLAGKVFAGVDPRQIYAYGSEFPFERRPAQAIREFTPTTEALQFMRNQPIQGVFRRDIPIGATSLRRSMVRAGVIHPQVLTHYALPGTAASTLYNLTGLAQNESFMVNQLSPVFNTQRIRNATIGLDEAIGGTSAGPTGIKDWLLAHTTGKTNQPYSLIPGEQIGYSPGRGEAILASNRPESVQEQIVGAKIFESERKGSVRGRFATLTILEKHSGPPKTFGSSKDVWHFENAQYLQDVAKRAGLHAKNLETISYIDTIKKSRSLVRQQMLGSLALETHERLQQMRVLDRRRLRMNRLERVFKSKHEQYDVTTSQIQQLARETNRKSRRSMRKFLRISGSASAVEKMMPNELTMLARAKAWGLDISQIGGVLPFAKDVIPPDVIQRAERLAGPAGLVPKSGWIRSLASHAVGAYAHTASSAVMSNVIPATIEPRGLANLVSNKWMVEGENVAEMLAGSLVSAMDSYGPDLNELQLVAQSTLGKPIAGVSVSNIAQNFELTSQGYMLNLGQPLPALGGSSQIYVPGEEQIRRLTKFRAKTGDIFGSDLFNAYKDLHASAKAATLARDQDVAIASMNVAAEAVKKALATEISMSMFGRGSGSGIHGALRSNVAGSAWLRLESVNPSRQVVSENLSYVSELAGSQMFEQLEARTTGEQLGFIRSQKERFMRGEAVAGVMGRHPTLSPSHILPTMIMRSNAPGTAERFFTQVPEQVIRRANVSGLGALDINVSPVVGMFADYDNDFLSLMLIGDQKTAAATEKLLSGSFSPYAKYAAEQTVLSTLAKQQFSMTPAATINTAEAMSLSGAKMRVAAGEIAKISIPLTEARLAMATHYPEAATQFGMLSAIMEEQILKGKKMKSLRQNIARQVATSIGDIQRAGDVDVNELARVTREMFGSNIESGISIAMEGSEAWTFKVDAQATWKQVQDAMHQATQQGGIVTRYRQLARGSGHQLALDEVLSELKSAQAGRSDVLTNLAVRGMSETKRTGRFASIAQQAITDINQGIKRAGVFAKSWGKPLLAGLAVSAGIAMVRSGPRTQPMTPPPPPQHGDVHGMAEANNMQARAMVQGIAPASRDLRPENMPIPEQVHGQPTAPGMASPKTYMTGNQGYRVIARGNTSGAPDQATIGSAIRQVTPQANVGVTFRDNRRKMTSQDVDNILERP